jgi:hypothetical protein
MRLLNTKSQKVEYFQAVIPSYVILSHTWDEEEVSFQDISGARDISHLKGYRKINQCCEQAISDGYEYAWIDTCCIDKTSSAELSEAINSMFQWYQDADICYAYLCDINHDAATEVDYWKFLGCRWFRRGWTLQELIAPLQLVFYDKDWVEMGTKSSLRNILSKITRIDVQLFVDARLNDYSIAQRMSWASMRSTTRPEDEAYCLMGIFGVNMPLLYGEGKKSFVRLQEEIMKRSDDHSLFAWRSSFLHSRFTGLLATSPNDFSESGNIVRIADELLSGPYSITNKGVQMTLPFLQHAPEIFPQKVVLETKGSFFKNSHVEDTTPTRIDLDSTGRVALLHCEMSHRRGRPIVIVLKKFKNEIYLRSHHNELLISPPARFVSKQTTIFVGLLDVAESPRLDVAEWHCNIRTLPLLKQGFFVLEHYPSDCWSHSQSASSLDTFDDVYGHEVAAALLFMNFSGCRFALVMQRRNRGRRFYADVTRFQDNENAEAVLQRCKADLKPLDRITYKLDEGKVVLVTIRKRPGAFLVDINI